MAHLSSNERQEIEDYLKQYSIEACLDEAINEVVEKRPENPYMAIAQCMEAKTLPEIMDVYIYSKIVGEGRGGVEAIVETNIGKFRSLVTIPASTESGEVMRDFSIIREKIRESLRRQDPKNLSEIDSTLLKIPGIEPPISLAVSIACCRAGARHRAMPLYKYLAESAGTPSGLCIPVPSVSVLSRVSAEGKPEQEISLLPISSNDLDFALDAMLQCLAVVETKVSSLGLPFSRSRNGCICVQTPTIGEALELVNEALKETAISPGTTLKVGIDYKAAAAWSNISQAYDYEAAGAQSGQQVVDGLVALWQSTGAATVEDLLSLEDTASLEYLKTKFNQVCADIKSSGEVDKIPAALLQGLGGDEGCPVQIVADAGVVRKEDVNNVAKLHSSGSAETAEALKAPINTVKVRLQKGATVTSAIAANAAAVDAGLSVIIGVDEDAAETDDSFVADLAVGLGAGQLALGGVRSGEYACKCNRLLDITREEPLIPYFGRGFRIGVDE